MGRLAKTKRNFAPSVVSVIIPTYGRPDRLGTAIRSALQQSYPHMEIVVVDDNVPDSPEHRATEELVARDFSDPTVRYVKTPENRGGAGARNFGVAVSTGDYLAFLDDDDRWLPEKIGVQIGVFDQGKESLGLVYTGLRVEDGEGNLMKNRPATASGWIRDQLALNNVVGTTSSAMVPRRVFEEVGGFDPNFPARQDLDLWFRIAGLYQIFGVDQVLTVNVRHQGERITLNPRRKLRARLMFYRKYRSYFRQHRDLAARYLFITGRSCAKHGLPFRARWFFLVSFFRRPSGKAFAAILRATVR